MPLIYGDMGKQYRVQKVLGNNKTRQHLVDLGITDDCPITIVTKLSGNMILQIRDTRLAIGEDLAKQIMIKEI